MSLNEHWADLAQPPQEINKIKNLIVFFPFFFLGSLHLSAQGKYSLYKETYCLFNFDLWGYLGLNIAETLDPSNNDIILVKLLENSFWNLSNFW